MAEREFYTKEILEEDYQDMIEQALHAINVEHNYIKGYDLATQAKLIAHKYLENLFYIIESERIRGLAYLGIDSMIGHDLIEKLYYENRQNLSRHFEQSIKLELALAVSKRIIGEYDEAIGILCQIYKYAQKEIEKGKNGEATPKDYNEIRLIIRCYLEIGCCLIYKSQQRNYSFRVKRMEERIRQLDFGKDDPTQQIHSYINETYSDSGDYASSEVNNDLQEAERYLKEALLMSRENDFHDLELFCLLDYACVLIEREEYEEALNILEEMRKEPYAKENLFGYIMDEIGIIYVSLGKYEEAKNIFDLSWNWLCERNDVNELSRNCYGTALYFFKKGNLDLAYAFAELAYKKDQSLPCLRLLYEVCLLKYISAQRLGNESEYVFYRSEYDRYKLQLERRG